MELEAYAMINILSDFIGELEEHPVTSNLKIHTSHYCSQPVPALVTPSPVSFLL